MKALVFHGPGQSAWEDVPDPGIQEPTDAIVRVDAVDHLRHRPAHPQGRCARGTPRHGPRARGRRRGRRGGQRRAHGPSRRPGPGLVHHRLRPLPLLPGEHVRTVPGRRRLDPRPPDRRHPGRVRPRAATPTCPCTRCPARWTARTPCCWPTSSPPPTRWACSTGACGPETPSPWSEPGPIGLAAIATARLFSPEQDHRRGPGPVPAGGRQAARRRCRGRRGARSPEQLVADLTDGLGRRRGHRGGRGAGELRDCARAWCGPAGMWPTSACTASPRRCTWKTCGSRT